MKLEYKNRDHCKTIKTRFENFRRERMKMNGQQAISEVMTFYEIDSTEEEVFRKFLAAVDRVLTRKRKLNAKYARQPRYETIRQRIKSEPGYGKKKKSKAEQLSLL